MKKTNRYQLNLIEGTDAFSPDPLNQNAEMIEDVLASFQKDLGTIGQNLRVETGSYTGTGTYGANYPNSLSFHIQPLLVFIAQVEARSTPPCIMMKPFKGSIFAAGNNAVAGIQVTWMGDYSVSWYAVVDADSQANTSNKLYYYAALGF